MRKFIACGVGAVATATLALGVAGPATAAVTTPGALTNQVCSDLPGQIVSAVNAVTSATVAQVAAAADLSSRTTDLAAAQGDLVDALVDYILTVDEGGSVDAKVLVLHDMLSIFSEKAAAWGNASTALDDANRNLAIANMTGGVLDGLVSGLSCVLPS